MRQYLLFFVISPLLLLGACSSDTGQPEQTAAVKSHVPAERGGTRLSISPEAIDAAASIDGTLILDTVREIASDDYQGRAPASEGDRKTLDYLAAQMKLLGLEPGAGDGKWQQRFALVGINSAQPPQWSFSSAGGSVVLKQHDEFIAGSGVQAEQSVINNAELVFVGYGIQAPEYNWDDYKGVDLKGKVLVMLNNDPDWDPELFQGKRRLYYGRWTYKYEAAARQGAVAAIIIHTTPSAGYPWQVVQTSWTGEQFELPAGDEPRIQVAGWVTDSAAGKLFTLAGQDMNALIESARSRDFTPVPLSVKTSLTMKNTLSQVESANVLGVLHGSDPELSDQALIYTAHHDHLGVAPLTEENRDQDRIYNGARDNASGVGMILSIARAFTKLPTPPRRSILFAFVGAEESGLLGSKHFARHPTFPAGKLAANINYDSANIWGRAKDMVFIGYGKSSLDQVADTVAKYQDRYVQGDQFPDKGYFYRSDQFNLAKIGVPAMYLEGGTVIRGKPEGWGKEQMDAYTAVNYHQPSDELDESWVMDGVVEDAQYGFLAGWLIANSDAMPAWNPGDEFEAARLKALANQ